MVTQKPSVAYSYFRFSTREQAKGDSLRRQAELRNAWLDRNPSVKLDEALTLADKGVSGFKGEHRDNADRHALAEFLRLVENGRIPEGSYLIVESLDRLSREFIQPALRLLLGLLEKGIRIVQLLPVETVYDNKSDVTHLMMALMELSRGHSESQMKSERVGRVWANKKRQAVENGKPLTARAPAWLRLADGRFEVDKAAAATVRRIFQLATDGYGYGSITTTFNKEGVPNIGTGKVWTRSYVGFLLANRAVIGEYQPHVGRRRNRRPDGAPIPNYYPAIITEDQFYAARAALSLRSKNTGRPVTGHVNVFAGLLRDARDHGRMRVVDKGERSPQRVLRSYRSELGVAGSVRTSFPFETFEKAVLSLLREVDPKDVLPHNGHEDKAAVLAGQLAEIEAEIEKVKARLLVKYSDPVADVLDRHEAKRKTLGEQLTEARQDAASPLGEAWGDCSSLIAALDGAPNTDDARVKLRAAIRRIAEQIWCLFVGRGLLRIAAVQVWFPGGACRSYVIVHRPASGRGGRRPAQWRALSLAEVAGAEPMDLREPEHARRLERLLAAGKWDEVKWDDLPRETREQTRAERNRRRREQWQKEKDGQNRIRREKQRRKRLASD
jgi:DNA invertase Pin-like site-specific DNA recombinase